MLYDPESEFIYEGKNAWRIVDFYLQEDDLGTFIQLVKSTLETSEYRTQIDADAGVGYSLEKLQLMDVLCPLIIISGYITENQETIYYQDLIAFTVRPSMGKSYVVSGAGAAPVTKFFNYLLACIGTYFPDTKNSILNYFKRLQTVYQTSTPSRSEGMDNKDNVSDSSISSGRGTLPTEGKKKLPRSTTLKAVALARYYIEKRSCSTIQAACFRAHTSLVSFNKYRYHMQVESFLKLLLENEKEASKIQSTLTNFGNRRKKTT